MREVFGGVADAGVVLPAAGSRWAVHWAQNPEVALYNQLFEFCRNATPHFSITVHSSYNRSRVCTLQTIRAVDLEQEGAPSAEQTRSRVSYMRVPYFLGPQDFNERACDRVVGLQIVGVEYLNEQNVLVTVLAAWPRDYDTRTGHTTARARTGTTTCTPDEATAGAPTTRTGCRTTPRSSRAGARTRAGCGRRTTC